jgi:hypothetical protein
MSILGIWLLETPSPFPGASVVCLGELGALAPLSLKPGQVGKESVTNVRMIRMQMPVKVREKVAMVAINQITG